MIYEEGAVPPGFDGAIVRTWFLDGEPPRPFEKILPMPFAHLIITLSEPYRVYDRTGAERVVPLSFVSGLQSEYLVIRSPSRIRHVGIEFSATALGALAPGSVSEVTDDVRAADGLFPGIETLRGGLRDVADAREALEALASYASGLDRHPLDPVATAAVALIESDTERPIGLVASALGVSHDELVHRFRHATGTTPKRHARVVRFHRFIDAVHARGGPPNWADLAVAAGYYDQPHVIREFRAFSGWTPAQYYRLVEEHGADAAHFVPLDRLPDQASS